jgi:WD40 repeat protein
LSLLLPPLLLPPPPPLLLLLLMLLLSHQGYILKCLISPDVQQLATTSSDKTVKLWNLDGFTLERTLTGHTRWVWDCVFSVDAAYLVTASSDATARLWDLSTGANCMQCLLLLVVATTR